MCVGGGGGGVCVGVVCVCVCRGGMCVCASGESGSAAGVQSSKVRPPQQLGVTWFHTTKDVLLVYWYSLTHSPSDWGCRGSIPPQACN